MVQIWSLDTAQCMHVLRHDDKLYALSWCASQKLTSRMLLATYVLTPILSIGPASPSSLPRRASFDKTCRIWETRSGNCLYTLAGHSMPVYSVHFSHDGAYLASGSFDHSLIVWSVEVRHLLLLSCLMPSDEPLQTGQMLKRYTGDGGVFEVAWSHDDKRIAACSADSMVAVINFTSAK